MKTIPAALSVATVALALAACGGGTPEAVSTPEPTASTPAATTSATSDPSATPTSTPTSAPSTAPADLTATGWFPTQVGTVWTYDQDTTTGPISQTQTLSAATPVDGGTRITLAQEFDTGGDVAIDYVLRDDGTIEVPFQTFSTAGVEADVEASGAVAWPSPADHAAGTVQEGSFDVSISVAGTTVDSTASYTSTPAGREEVSVPAGTYDAAVMDIDITVTSQVGDQEVGLRVWLVEGIGYVKQELDTAFAGATIELTLFTTG